MHVYYTTAKYAIRAFLARETGANRRFVWDHSAGATYAGRSPLIVTRVPARVCGQ
jgi:hypothetical protein